MGKNIKNMTIEEKIHLAIYGNDKQKDVLLDDEDEYLREMIAIYGNTKHRNILVNDENWIVRNAVAQYGNKKHLKILINDEFIDVRNKAKESLEERKRLEEEILEIFPKLRLEKKEG